MAVCEICGKTARAGRNVSFSMRHTRRKFKPNIQKTRVLRDGELVSIKACAKCIKAMAKDLV